jgi:conjugal transfer pilus assembly protein TraU
MGTFCIHNTAPISRQHIKEKLKTFLLENSSISKRKEESPFIFLNALTVPKMHLPMKAMTQTTARSLSKSKRRSSKGSPLGLMKGAKEEFSALLLIEKKTETIHSHILFFIRFFLQRTLAKKFFRAWQKFFLPKRAISTKVFGCLFLAFSLLVFQPLHAKCVGRFVNPVTDICWKCLFPIKIAGFTIAKGGADPESVNKLLCTCGKPLPRVGIPVSFWEPARLVDVTRTPYCLVNMGGISVANTGTRGRGDIEEDQDTVTKKSFYQVHWYTYPVVYWLELLIDFVCLESLSIDLAYVTELDPLWNDDEKNSILNPEALLFGNVIAQAACAADCIAVTANLPLDPLFWCGGCQGSLYPFTGTVDHHTGGVQASLLIVQKMIARLHREGLLWGYMGEAGLCGKYFMPFIRKSQYRTQMTYPVSNTKNCHPLGHTEIFWGAGKEFPYKGSDFGYLIWRKRDCCMM